MGQLCWCLNATVSFIKAIRNLKTFVEGFYLRGLVWCDVVWCGVAWRGDSTGHEKISVPYQESQRPFQSCLGACDTE